MKPQVFILAIVVVVLGLVFESSANAQWGQCSCGCIKSECDYPKTSEECQKCASAVSSPKSSWDEGKCWIKVGNISPMDCALRCQRSLTGCSGFAGVSHYTYGNMCWCVYKNP